MLITPRQAFDQHLSNIFITTDGIIAEILPDDIVGVKHQRFIILTDTGQSILVVHNISQNTPVTLLPSSKVHIEGTYVWNRYGGIIHETHTDVHKPHPDGEIVVK